jgi:hypothetical protein
MDRTSPLKRRGGRRLFGRQRGVTLLEALAALLIGALVIAGVSRMINVSLNDSRDQQVAAYQQQIAAAVGQAIKLNYNTLLGIPATPSTVYSMSDLVALNFLPPSFANAKNGFGQSFCLLVQQPSPGQIDAMLITTGGTAIPDVDLGYIAANSGVGGGLIGSSQPGNAVGAYGGWSAPLATWNQGTCTGAVGHLANQVFMTGPGNQSTDFLYRVAVPGHPELNAMNAGVPIGLSTATAGAACVNTVTTANIFTADNTTKRLLTCINGVWTLPTWLDNSSVTNVSKLPLVVGAMPGDVRITADTQLPYVWTGTKWSPLAVDDNGALNFPKFVTAGDPCGAALNSAGVTVSTDQQIGIDSTGNILVCRGSPNRVWTTSSTIVVGANDTACMIIYPSSGAATDYAGCKSDADIGATFSFDPTSQTENNTVIRPITLNQNGLVTVTTYAHMNYAQCNVTGWLGQLTQYLDILDSSGNSIAHTEAQTPNIQDASAGVSMTLNQALPATDSNGITINYKVSIRTNWGLFTPTTQDHQATWSSSYCPNGPINDPGIIINTPLAMGWSINTVY